MKAASTSAFPVNGNSPSRHGEYFHKAVAVDNSANPVYQSIISSAWLDGLTNSTTGSVFVARSPEVFAYDADGNLTSDGQWNYKWDAENRLVQMESLAGVPTEAKRRLEFTYDYIGRRVQKTVSTNNGSAYVVCETSKYVYDGWNLVAILNPDLSLQKSFLWGLDASGTMQGAGGVGGLLSMTVHSGPQAGTYFTCYDGNHNLVGLARGNDGAVVAKYEYGPFGELIRATGPLAKVNPFMFSTKYEDTESGLLYYGYRSYSPSTGRWLSRDPIEEYAWRKTHNNYPNIVFYSQNLYGFVLNDPISHYDVLGLKRDCDAEHIQCFRDCWGRKPPWPCTKGKHSHYAYCEALCLAEYMACGAANAAEEAANLAKAVAQWIADHPGAVVGTIVVIGGITFIVATGGGGAIILVPAAL